METNYWFEAFKRKNGDLAFSSKILFFKIVFPLCFRRKKKYMKKADIF